MTANGEQRITHVAEDKDNNLCVKDDKGEIRNRLDDDITLTTKNEATDKTETTDETATTDETETTGEIKTTHNAITIDTPKRATPPRSRWTT